MGRVYHFNVGALCVQMIILFSIYFRKMYRGRTNKAFIRFVICVLLDTIFDIMSSIPNYVLPGVTDKVIFREISSYGYFTMRLLTPVFFMNLVGNVSGTWDQFNKKKICKCIVLVPVISGIAIIVSNLFTNNVFYYTADGVYHRGELLKFLYTCGLLLLIVAMIYLLINQKYIEWEKFVSMSLLIPINLLALVVQFFYPKLLIEMFAITISTLLITVTVIRPEAEVDPSIAAKTYHAFRDDIRRYYLSKRKVNVIFVKITNHKAINQLLGNDTYRTIIHDIAVVINPNKTSIQKKEITPYYLDNGLFAVLIGEKAGEIYATEQANRINRELSREFKVAHIMVKFDTRIMMVRIPSDVPLHSSFVNMISSFHKNLPVGKVCFFKNMTEKEKRNITNDIDTVIAKAIEEGRFCMYYQPIYSVKEQRFTCAEALIRMIDEEGNLVLPAVFLPSAEKSGAIHLVGNFAMDEVFGFAKRMDMKALGLEFIEFNISPIQVMNRNLDVEIHNLIKKHDMKKQNIVIEFREVGSDYVMNLVEKKVKEYQSSGVRFALDDYGTGYSNLQKIMRIPFEFIKIDQSLTGEINDPKMQSVVENTIRMVKDIDVKVTVEGIEDMSKARRFEKLGCDYIQGNCFAEPMREEDFIEFMKKNRNGLTIE